jgi:magnesium-transporting ATPase (P-type)
VAHSSEGVLWRDIQVGDVLRMNDKQPLPADVMLLYTSEDEHVAYIETSQIDGETNLKLRRAVPVYSHVAKVSAEEAFATVRATRATIECEGPNTRINSFTGVYRPDGGAAVPIDIENVILRGSVLRNTRWAYGIVVYTGRDTKLQVRHYTLPHTYTPLSTLMGGGLTLIRQVLSCLHPTFVCSWKAATVPCHAQCPNAMSECHFNCFGQ